MDLRDGICSCVFCRLNIMVTLPLVLHHKPSPSFLILAPPTSGYPPNNAPSWILHAVSTVYGKTFEGKNFHVFCSTVNVLVS